MPARNEAIKERHVNLRANNNNIMQFKTILNFNTIANELYIKNTLCNSMHIDNKEKFIELITENKDVLRVTFEFRTVPTKRVPNRQLEQFVLYVNGTEVYYAFNQKKIIKYIKENLL